jgi:imidazolonepropionase
MSLYLSTKAAGWTLIRGARQLLTLHHTRGPRRAVELANLGAITDGSVLLHNGVIEAVGPTRRVENLAQARDAEEIDASGRVVMPAFIDAHACLVQVTAGTVQNIPATRLEAQADQLLKILASHGTGSIGAVTGCALDASGEVKILRAMHALQSRPVDLVPIAAVTNRVWADEEVLRSVKGRKLASVAQVRCGEGGVSAADTESFLTLAQRLGFAVRCEMARGHDAGMVEAAIRLQALSISVMEGFKRDEIEMLASSPTFAILLPARNLADESPRLMRQLVDAGGWIALGSGLGPETDATGSMQTVVQLACRRFGLTLEEAICAATCNAAWALGLGGLTGSLEHGKSADLILLNASDYREIQHFEGTNLTHSLIKRGVVVCKEDFPGWPAD